MKVDIAFLESKSFEIPNPWDGGRPCVVSASHTNIHRISDSVFKFTEYNFLPADETDILDGHYTFFVNKDTFEYLVYKSSDYGSLTYTIPCEFGGAFLTKESLPEFSRKRVEANIACKLLGAYFYDSAAIHSKGINLFSDGTPTEPSDRGVRFNDGCKRSLICDYRGYQWVDHVEKYSSESLKALEILCGYKQPNITLDEQTVKAIALKLRSCKVGKQKEFALNLEGKEYKVVYQKNNYKGHLGLTLDGKLISHDLMSNKITEFVRSIPEVLNNFATC